MAFAPAHRFSEIKRWASFWICQALDGQKGIAMSVHEQEEAFVKRFIVESKQDRYLHFLSKPTTRKKFLGELYHSLAINGSWATELLPRERTVTQVEQKLRSLGSGSLAYIISPQGRLDGQWLALTDVLTDILGTASEAIVCCLPGHLAFFLSEDSAYILHYPPRKSTL